MPKSDYDITPDATYPAAARAALRHQVDELMDNLDGTRRGDDVEALHDMRVASRRLRAAMSVFGAAFPPKEFRRLEKQVAGVTDALGAVRDEDVLLEFLAKTREGVAEAEQVGIDAFVEHLQKQRDGDRVDLIKALNKLERGAFRDDFQKMLGPKDDTHG